MKKSLCQYGNQVLIWYKNRKFDRIYFHTPGFFLDQNPHWSRQHINHSILSDDDLHVHVKIKIDYTSE